MYLSRMYLNPQRRGTRKLVANPEAMHAAVMSAFPPNTDISAGEGRVLWRLDSENHRLALYVVSRAQPSFEHLQEQAGWENQKSWSIGDYSAVLDSISVGKRFQFRLAANPVRSVHDPETGKQKRLGHVTAAQQRSWLLNRAEAIGVKFLEIPLASDPEDFSDEAVRVTRREVLRFPRKGKNVTIARAQFDGVLEVTDPAAFRTALTSGIGKAKGYGCGLLTVAPFLGSKE